MQNSSCVKYVLMHVIIMVKNIDQLDLIDSFQSHCQSGSFRVRNFECEQFGLFNTHRKSYNRLSAFFLIRLNGGKFQVIKF